MAAEPRSQQRMLKIAGTEVARIGLGTNRLTSSPENHAFLRQAVDAGLGMIDTAHVYSGGDSERAIGAALSPPPGGVVGAAKGGYSGRGGPGAPRAPIEQRPARPRTAGIDLYYPPPARPHNPPPTHPP